MCCKAVHTWRVPEIDRDLSDLLEKKALDEEIWASVCTQKEKDAQGTSGKGNNCADCSDIAGTIFNEIRDLNQNWFLSHDLTTSCAPCLSKSNLKLNQLLSPQLLKALQSKSH